MDTPIESLSNPYSYHITTITTLTIAHLKNPLTTIPITIPLNILLMTVRTPLIKTLQKHYNYTTTI